MYDVTRPVQITESVSLQPGDKIEVVSESRNTTSKTVAGNNTIITYQGTNVVTFNNDTIILDPNGWWTKTTKRRMNQTSDEHNLGYWVYQKRGLWYVDYRGKTIPFNDGSIILDR